MSRSKGRGSKSKEADERHTLTQQPDFAQLAAAFPEIDDPPRNWRFFLEDQLLNDRLTTAEISKCKKSILMVFKHQFDDTLIGQIAQKLVDAFIQLMKEEASPRYPQPILSLFDEIRGKLGYENAKKLFISTPFEPTHTRLRNLTLQTFLQLDATPEQFISFTLLVSGEKTAREALLLDDQFSNSDFVKLLESALRSVADDHRFFTAFFRVFDVRNQIVKKTLFQAMNNSNTDYRDMDKHFFNMRYGAIIADFKKFPLEVIEEKMRDPRDFQLLFDILRNHAPKRTDEAYSLLMRHQHAIELKRKEDRQLFRDSSKCVYLHPILRQIDDFYPTSVNLKEMEAEKVLKMKDFGVHFEDVVFIDNNDILDFAARQILESPMAGFDSEFHRANYNPFEKHKLALMQIYDGRKVYLFDCIALRQNLEFQKFLIHFFESKNVIKVGLGLDGDFAVLKSFLGKAEVTANRMIDLSKGQKFVEQVSLKMLCEKVFGKALCKYEQASAWDQRPLRLAQIHYAALDAVSGYKVAENLMRTGSRFTYEELKERKDELIDSINETRFTSSSVKQQSLSRDKSSPEVPDTKTDPIQQSQTQPANISKTDASLPKDDRTDSQTGTFKRRESKNDRKRNQKPDSSAPADKPNHVLSNQSQPFFGKRPSQKLRQKGAKTPRLTEEATEYISKDTAPTDQTPKEPLKPTNPKKRLQITSKAVDFIWVPKAS